ncbi:hypothetical protein BBF96_06530 [Anoxybacter fermentans]|uniref:DUF3795 domain-containing protein n=1 Tax=Anoxybacter fermentans TaxID=1323375 RepID=A0A3S9SXT7_9FIRM|nr:DUF3795 domain-containing protein [Anoxybacter fermentans]AZR73070.1 hypothetical protein BBF96_06530 [Anoxybacter fermentans]
MGMIAYCGIKCDECLVFIATKRMMKVKKRIANSWSTEKYPLNPEDVERYGCKNGDKIRQCNISFNLKSCVYCDNYPCNKISKVFEKNLDAQQNLEKSKEIKDIEKIECENI